jgi:hypothetical protein
MLGMLPLSMMATHVSHSTLSGQLADGEIRFAGQQLNNVNEQGDGAELLEAGPLGGRGG